VPRTDLLTVGESFQDLIFVGLPHMPRSGEELRTSAFVATIGGGALITATAASRLGVRTTVISALGAEAARALRADKVRVVNVKRPSEPHAVTVSLSTSRDRSFVTFDGVNAKVESRLPAAIARQPARHVHLAFAPTHCARWTRIVEKLRAASVTTSWDFGWNPRLRDAEGFRSLLAAADFIFVNEVEAKLYAGSRTRDRALAYWRRAARNTIVKLGARGSLWVAGRDHGARRPPSLKLRRTAEALAEADQPSDVSVPAPRVRVVDTTGAGDAFNGGFLVGWLEGRTARECLRLGNFVGAQSTLAPGGVDALPSRPTSPTSHTQPTRPNRLTRESRTS
jgi:sugar/nucleoside kinase (ribokinase family)